MIIGATQTKPIKGNIQANIHAHCRLIEVAVNAGAETVIFSELSLTGYEPTLAKQLATTIHDARLDVFQQISDSKNIAIGVGLPLQTGEGVIIGMVIFRPGRQKEVYAKKYLHADELPFFVSGRSTVHSLGANNEAALAICYEISVEEHTAYAFSSGARVFIAGVAKSVTGIGKALERMSAIASQHNAITIMANCTGVCDGEECAGKTSVFGPQGQLLGQLSSGGEGVLLIDSQTLKVSSLKI